MRWKKACEDEGRDQGDVCTNEGMPVITNKPPEAKGDAGEDSPSEGASSADILNLDF